MTSSWRACAMLAARRRCGCALQLLLILCLASCSGMRAAAAGQHNFTRCSQIPALFNFGDSNSDTGGLAALYGELPRPYGITFFHRPAGRYSDGLLLIDFIAEELGFPYLAANLQSVGSNFTTGANFATAGSTIRVQNTTFEQSSFSPISMGVQVKQFAEFKQRALTFHSREPFSSLLPEPDYFDEALYTVDIGQNDLTAGFALNLTSQQVEDSIPQIVQEFGDHVKYLHGQGAKKFMIVTTGPLGCLPYYLSRLPHTTAAEVDEYGCAVQYNMVARVYNRQLRETIHKLQQQLQDTTFAVVDGYSLKYNLFVNAQKDGFKSTLKACCGYGGGPYNFDPSLGITCGSKPKNEHDVPNTTYVCQHPSTYINWDGIHYTQAANHAVSKELFSGNFSTPTFPSGHFCHMFG